MMNNILVVGDEIRWKKTVKIIQHIKSKITADRKHYSRFLWLTNFIDAVPREEGGRRFYGIKVDESHKGNSNFWSNTPLVMH
jgi:hypothetical protein